MSDFHPTPHLAGHQPPTPEPTCGTLLPSMPDTPCDAPAAWHIRWARGDSETVPTSLTCLVHMDEIAAAHAWYERHPAGPACSSGDATWEPGRCAEVT